MKLVCHNKKDAWHSQPLRPRVGNSQRGRLVPVSGGVTEEI